jgi:hypothetical protein
VFDWLVEGRPTVYVILGVAAAILLALWWRDRKRHWLIGVLGVFLLVGAYFLLSRLVQTPRKQVVRGVEEMAAAVQAGDVDRIMAHVSEQFRYRSLNKSSFREKVKTALAQKQVERVEVWEFKFPEEQPGGKDGPIRVSFIAKPFGGPARGVEHFRCEADFVRDPDGRWRMKTFEVFHPFIETRQPLEILELGP